MIFQKSFPTQLFKWFCIRLAVFLFLGLIFCFTVLSFFFDEPSLPLVLGFAVGFSLSAVCASVLYIRVLDLTGRAFEKVRMIAFGEERQDQKDSFIQETGEFYRLHKNLNKIDNKLKWQKKIISQESSELEAVISAIRGTILAVNENQKVLFFNRRATLLFEQDQKPRKKDLFLSELVRNPAILSCYSQCLTDGQVVTKKIESDLGDENRSYEVSVAPLKEPGGSVQGAVGLFYDITDIEKIEKQQMDFISNVSHELRTPLTAIQGYVQTILIELKESKTDNIQKFLEIINSNVKRLVSLLNHFLELSRWKTSFEMKKELVSTQEITEAIVKDLHIKNHQLKFDFSAETVSADRHFLKQVLYNLLDNAVRYVPQGRLIEVIWEKKPDRVELTVRDQGGGIKRQHKNRIFEKFFRVDQARKKGAGSGIGLYIVKEIIEKHGGTVTLESREREGSRFICTFPEPM